MHLSIRALLYKKTNLVSIRLDGLKYYLGCISQDILKQIKLWCTGNEPKRKLWKLLLSEKKI